MQMHIYMTNEECKMLICSKKNSFDKFIETSKSLCSYIIFYSSTILIVMYLDTILNQKLKKLQRVSAMTNASDAMRFLCVRVSERMTDCVVRIVIVFVRNVFVMYS